MQDRVLFGGIALVMCCGAWADTAGVLILRSDLPDGRVAIDAYVTLSSPSSRVLGVIGKSIYTTVPGGFYQSPNNPFWQPGIQNAATSADSFVTIGTNPNGNGNTSSGAVVPFAFDNFTDEEGATDFGIIGEPVYQWALWSLPGANTQWGYPIAGRVLIGRFVVEHPTVCDRFGASLSVSWKPSTGGVSTLHWEQSSIPIVIDLACGTGCYSCCEPHPGNERYCSDAVCCAAVCGVDPSCCTVAWDQECVQLASLECTGCGGGGCVGDLDNSGAVDGQDLGELLSGWGRSGTGDLNGDGTVNGEDLGALLAAWGECP